MRGDSRLSLDQTFDTSFLFCLLHFSSERWRVFVDLINSCCELMISKTYEASRIIIAWWLWLKNCHIFVQSLMNFQLLLSGTSWILSSILLYNLIRPSIGSRLRLFVLPLGFNLVHEPLEFNVHVNSLPVLKLISIELIGRLIGTLLCCWVLHLGDLLLHTKFLIGRFWHLATLGVLLQTLNDRFWGSVFLLLSWELEILRVVSWVVWARIRWIWTL